MTDPPRRSGPGHVATWVFGVFGLAQVVLGTERLFHAAGSVSDAVLSGLQILLGASIAIYSVVWLRRQRRRTDD